MPLPKRKKKEKKEDFMSRCMGDDTMNEDFPDQKQRYAVCQKQCDMMDDASTSKTCTHCDDHLRKVAEENWKASIEKHHVADYLDELIERANIAMGKKLTTKDRKKLSKSVFCGPNRSFPCNDCNHVRAAKSFLSRSKFSDATKKKIAACINNKAKALKCSGDKKAKASVEFDGEFYPKFIELSREEKELYSSDIFKSTKELVEESIKNPGMELDFTGMEDCDCE